MITKESSIPIIESQTEITKSWMQRALENDNESEFPQIEKVHVESIGETSGALAEIYRCGIEYSDETQNAPNSVIVKIASPHPGQRAVAKTIRLYLREFKFYIELSKFSPVATPIVYYADFDTKTHKFVLVIEDLAYLQVGNQLDGATEQQAYVAMRNIAKIHAEHWNLQTANQVADFTDMSSLYHRILLQITYVAALDGMLFNYRDKLSESALDLAEKFGPLISIFTKNLAKDPLSFVHGDFRIENMFFDHDNPEALTIIDWQVCGIGPPLYDVSYFMAGSVPTELRRKIERDVLKDYHATLLDNGVQGFSFEDCWRLYRQNVLLTFIPPVVVAGGFEIEFDRMQQVLDLGIQRGTTTAEDLNVAEFLPKPKKLRLSYIFVLLMKLLYKIFRRLNATKRKKATKSAN